MLQQFKFKENWDFFLVSRKHQVLYSYYFAPDPMLASGKFLEYVQSPNCHSIVLYHDAKAKEIYPVFITKGCYLSNGRVSNFWNWCRLNEDLSLGEEECGYGNFYTPIQKFDVKVLFKIERISV